MKEVWEPGERIVVRLPLTAGPAFAGIGIGFLPVVPVFAWLFTLSPGEADRGFWVVPMLIALLGGQWAGFLLARRWFGRTLTLDWTTRVATVNDRSFPFADVTKVELVDVIRQLPRSGRIAVVSIVVRTATEELAVRVRTGAPSERDTLVKELRPDAKKLARSLRRELDLD